VVDITGIILAGGKSSRMQKNKAFLTVGNLQIIERIRKELREVCSDLMIVTNSPEEYVDLGIKTVVDIIPRQGPLSGVHAGLVNSKHNYNLVVACDMPFISKQLAKYIIERASGYDAIVPRINGLPQPLFAVYSKACIGPIEQCLNSETRKMTAFYHQINICWIDEMFIRELELGNPNTIFLNVNTPQDWEGAEELVQQKKDNDLRK